MLDVPPYCTGQHDLLEVSTFLYQISHLVAMGDADDVLLDDRTVVQGGSHVVAGGPNELHPTLESAMLGTSTTERREEGMVHVDDTLRILGNAVS